MKTPAIGPCDALDGPVIALARKALETEDVNHVLPWVRAANEDEIRRAFRHALAARKLGLEARELADRRFFEALVRAHRASEGAPYAGIRPAGTNIGPGMPAAAQALETGHAKALVNLLINAVRSGVHRHLQAAMDRRNFAVDDIAAGRAYVEAYESCLHYVEQLLEAANRAGPPAHTSREPDVSQQGTRVH